MWQEYREQQVSAADGKMEDFIKCATVGPIVMQARR